MIADEANVPMICLLAVGLVALGPSASASPETELEAKLPEIFSKAAAHYRALDAAATPLMRGAKGEPRVPHGWNERRNGRRELDMRSIYWWTSGHYPGSLWYLYEATGDDFFRARATVWTELLEPVSKYTGTHDVGFMMYCSYGNARRVLKTDKYDALLVETANSLCRRYDEKLGLIRSWGQITNKNDFLVIPDNMMNLELLEFAAGCKTADGRARSTSAPRTPAEFAAIAESHADVSMRNHFRSDGGCYHVLNYDQRPKLLGKVREIRRGQGASCGTAWSRGQSWGIYGYTMMYRTSGCVRYLDFAKKLADYAMNHPNMPADGVPYWDYGAPGEERDTSAASCMASALVELSQYVGAADRDRYRAFAVRQLLALASPDYFSEGDEIGHWLLKHGVGNKPGGGEIDTPLNYGDYYFLEALLRFRNLRARERAIAGLKGMSALPPKAMLPADELAVRSHVAASNLADRVEKALAGPIPDTTDELYGEFWVNGNRTHYEKVYFARLHNLDALATAAVTDDRCLARVEDYLAAICDMKSWVLPAHDGARGGKSTFRGEWISTDLFATELGAHLACVVRLVGNRLKPATVARVKAETERRVFAPVRRETSASCFPGTAPDGVREKAFWWMNGRNNWAAVCWDNIVCAAMGLIDDAADRAFFVRGADICMDRYLAKGFEADGYCSEGMGYWNYGYGHYLMMGRMLHRLTDGKLDLLHRAKSDLASAYPRAYTLAPGVSPAFADGNGAVSPKYLALVDEFWPDLPKGLPAASEFPDGQVWLLRDPKGLSVAFKGGHNDEHHNHNDVGSYYLVDGGAFVAGDPGGEVYTARTFSGRRYESKVINSYGHPVPVVGGKLQSTGRAFAAKVLEKKLEVEGERRSVVTLDLTGAYAVKALTKLTRTFVYDRAAKTFTVRDHAEFSEPTAFEECTVTLEGKKAARGGAEVRSRVEGLRRCTAKGRSGAEEVGVTTRDELVENPDRPTPHRFAWTFEKPVTAADVEFVFESGKAR